MNYTKKLCILKQVASGFAADGREVSALLTAEQLGGRVTLTLAPIGFAPLSAGRYRCVVQDAAGGREAFDLPPEGAVRRCAGLDISRGLGCAVCFVHGRAQAVAFGRVGEGKYDPKAMCLPEGDAPAAAKGGAPHRGNGQATKNERPQAEQAERAGGRQAGPTARAGGQTASTNAAPTAEGTAPAAGRGAAGGQEGAPPYDDEKIAPENYFAFADAGENDRTGEEAGRACGRADAAPAASGGGGGEQAARRAQGAAGGDAGGELDTADGDAGGEAGGGRDMREGEGEGQTLFKTSGAGEPCYYDRVRGELEALFARHPRRAGARRLYPLLALGEGILRARQVLRRRGDQRRAKAAVHLLRGAGGGAHRPAGRAARVLLVYAPLRVRAGGAGVLDDVPGRRHRPMRAHRAQVAAPARERAENRRRLRPPRALLRPKYPSARALRRQSPPRRPYAAGF